VKEGKKGIRDASKIGFKRSGKSVQSPFDAKSLDEEKRKLFQDSLADLFQKNPNANPILVRREFEKKGVNWREYRDAIDHLQEQGLVDFSQNPDFAQLESYLNEPPLGPLRKMLHGIKFTGV